MGDVIPFKKHEPEIETPDDIMKWMQKEINKRCKGAKIPSSYVKETLINLITEAMVKGYILEMPLIDGYGFASPLIVRGSLYPAIVSFSFNKQDK